MAKGAYTFVTYPDSSDIEKVKEALNGYGWDWSISPLHDKDVNDKGDFKKAHYHVICGFKKGLPDYKEFRESMREIGGVVPPYEKCIVHDIEATEDYQAHGEDNDSSEGKAKYNVEDVSHSETWDISSYISYTARREKKHEKATKTLQDVICYCSKSKCSFSELVDNFAADGDALTVIFKNAYALTQYIKGIK